ncbi:hypothetical protein ACLB2K_036546 [Fragaria x ananassa]
METKKRRLSDQNTIAGEPCTSKRRRLSDNDTILSVCTSTSKRKRLSAEENMTSSEVCKTSKRKKLSSQLCTTTSKRSSQRRRVSDNESEVCKTSKRKKLSSQLCTTTSKRSSKRRRVSDNDAIPTKRRRITSPTLPPEILELIFKKLPALDAVRFPAICHSWKLAAKSSVSSRYTPLSQQPPMLMLPSVDKEQDKSSRPFFSSAEKKFYSIKNEFPQDDETVLSSHGWLLMYNYKQLNLPYLYHPLSGARIKLPELPLITDYWLPPYRAAVSTDPSRNNNFIVVIVLKLFPQTRMIFLKHGDSKWTDLGELHDDFALKTEIMFYEDQLFVVSINHIVVWDFRGESSPSKTTDFQISGLKRGKEMFTYIVESQGEILYVKQFSRIKADDLYVYRLVFKDREWKKVESLIDRALFLGGKETAMSLSTRNFPTVEGNSIYLVEIYQPAEPKLREFRVQQYNLKDKKKKKREKIKQFTVNERSYYPTSLWILPNPILHGEKKNK